MAPAGTPRPIIERLNKELLAGLKSEQMQARFKQLGAIAEPGTPEDFAAFMTKEVPKWVTIVKLSGVRPE
jgi:tripartite-type tricarboxylate transporter receptor subunit TctC